MPEREGYITRTRQALKRFMKEPPLPPDQMGTLPGGEWYVSSAESSWYPKPIEGEDRQRFLQVARFLLEQDKGPEKS